MSSNPVRKARAIRMVEVCRVLHLMDHRVGLTAYQLAFWIDLKPNANFYKILREAKRLGWLAEKSIAHRPGQTKSIWLITPRGKRVASQHHTTDVFDELRPSLRLSKKSKEGIKDEVSF